MWSLTDKPHTFFQKIIYFTCQNLYPRTPPTAGAPGRSLIRTLSGWWGEEGIPVGTRASFPTAFRSVLVEHAEAQTGTGEDKYSWKSSIFFSVCFSRCVILKTVNGACSMWFIRRRQQELPEERKSVSASSGSGSFLSWPQKFILGKNVAFPKNFLSKFPDN